VLEGDDLPADDRGDDLRQPIVVDVADRRRDGVIDRRRDREVQGARLAVEHGDVPGERR